MTELNTDGETEPPVAPAQGDTAPPWCRGVDWTWQRVQRLCTLVADLASASYFATEWHDSEADPDATDVHQVVAKTRGSTQFYQDPTSFAYSLTWDDLKRGRRPMINPTREVSELEAAALNHALSVRRKFLGGLVILGTGVVLEACGVDISLFT